MSPWETAWAWYWSWPAPVRRVSWMIVGVFGDNMVGALAGTNPSSAVGQALKKTAVDSWGLLHPLLAGLG